MDVTKPTEISQLLKEYGAKVRKSWGQNFLINNSVVEGILEAAELEKTDTVLEVGPGLGVMTQHLVNATEKVVAVEIDPLLFGMLKDRLGKRDNLALINDDAMEQDFSQLANENYKVVANLPYYITSPFIAKLLEDYPAPKLTVFLVQLEVAKRMAATAGTSDYGALSVLVQYYCNVDIVQKVGPGNFYPPPKVDSAVVRLRRRESPIYANKKLMFRIVKTAFGQRRKMLKGLLAREFKMDVEKIKEILESVNLHGDIRGEKLSVNQFADLATAMEGEMK